MEAMSRGSESLRPTTKVGRNRGGATAGLLMLAGIAGCDALLEVKLPGQVAAEALSNPALAEAMLTGVIAEFECGFNEYALLGAVVTDELETASAYQAYNRSDARSQSIQDYGAAECSNVQFNVAFSPYLPLHRARAHGEDTYKRISEFDGLANREAMLARAAVYVGYSLVLLGEGYCSTALDGGPALPPAEIAAIAEQRFTTAITHAQAAGATDIRHLATIGRARARLNKGDRPGALSDAQSIPAGFNYNVERGTQTVQRQNRFVQSNNLNGHSSVDPAFRDLKIDGVPDPRVRVVFSGGNGQDGLTRLWVQEKYANLSSPISLGSWREAQLIIAEVAEGQGSVAAINRLRDRVGLPHFSSTDPVVIRNQMIEERRRELFLQGHRLGDFLRYDLPWQQGATHKGEPFGSVTCLPMMLAESLTNPNVGS